MRRLATHKPGVASLRHDRSGRFTREPEDCGDLGDAARSQYQRRMALIEPSLLADIRCNLGGIRNRVTLADDRGEAGDQLGRQSPHWHFNDIHGSRSVVTPTL